MAGKKTIGECTCPARLNVCCCSVKEKEKGKDNPLCPIHHGSIGPETDPNCPKHGRLKFFPKNLLKSRKKKRKSINPGRNNWSCCCDPDKDMDEYPNNKCPVHNKKTDKK